MAESQIAQSRTSRAPHFPQCQLKKRPDQSNREERHAAISCHAFCGTARLSPLFCIYSCQQNRLNATQCSTSCAKCAQLNYPLTHMHTHADTHSHTHTITMIISWLCDLITNVPQNQPFSGPTAESHCHILTFSSTRLIKHSLCCVGKAVNGVITDSKLGIFSPAERQLRLKESPLIETDPPWPLASSKCPSLNLCAGLVRITRNDRVFPSRW